MAGLGAETFVPNSCSLVSRKSNAHSLYDVDLWKSTRQIIHSDEQHIGSLPYGGLAELL